MEKVAEFGIESIVTNSKEIQSLTIDFPEGVGEIPQQSFLCSSGFCSKDQIIAEMSSRIHDRNFVKNLSGKLSLPVLVAKGKQEGQTMVVTAGIHGDEYEGMEAIYRIFENLDPEKMQGTFVALPIVTLPAFWLGIRNNPVDMKNMARVFPGSSEGTLSERLAWKLLQTVLRHADFYIDLHSSGRNYHMLTLCGYSTQGRQAEIASRAAYAFGAPVVWAHPETSPGRTLSATLDLEIPSLYTEAYGGGHVRFEDVECYTRGLANLLKFLDISVLDQAGLPEGYNPRFLRGSGDMDVAIKCRQGGMFFRSVDVGDNVRTNDVLGIVRGLEGRIEEKIVASQDSVVMLIRATPRIYPGETAAALTFEG